LLVIVSFAESPADDANIKDTNAGLQSSGSVETCPSIEETDDRELLCNKNT
jgi:hypothetical protein